MELDLDLVLAACAVLVGASLALVVICGGATSPGEVVGRPPAEGTICAPEGPPPRFRHAPRSPFRRVS